MKPTESGSENAETHNVLTIHVSAPYIPSTPSVAPTTKTEVSTETKPNGDKVITTTTTEFGNKVTEATQTNTSAAGETTVTYTTTIDTQQVGPIRAVLDDGANYKLITKEEKDALVKEIKASIAPKTTKKSVTAGKTSKRSVATVSKNGTIIGKKAGKATISAVVTLKDGSKKTVRMTVTVKAKKYNK